VRPFAEHGQRAIEQAGAHADVGDDQQPLDAGAFEPCAAASAPKSSWTG
jgi:hypothetical protein